MKKQRIFTRILIPTMMILFLVPPVSCGIFHQTAKKYAYEEAEKELDTLQKNLLPAIKACMQDETVGLPRERVGKFVREAATVIRRMNTDATFFVYTEEKKLVYPYGESEKAEVKDLSDQAVGYLGELTDETKLLVTTLKRDEGGEYLAKLYLVPVNSRAFHYMVTYCPTDRIQTWVNRASWMVFATSGGISLILAGVLWMVTVGITNPLERLCREANRIGEGSFDPIGESFDLKELESLRLTMNQMASKLEQSDIQQKTFFQNVSHDLRTPLMSIGGYAQGIEMGVFSDPKQAAHTIMEESMRLTSLVESLLTLSRLENGTTKPHLVPLKLETSIRQSMERMNGLAVQRGIRFIWNPGKEDGLVLADEMLMGKILDNLLSNALRYGKQQVEITEICQKGEVQIQIADDGPGIDPKDLPHIFERCYKGKGGNFGIGLAIVKAAIMGMGGRISAENRANGGAVFTLYLPECEK